jgi:tetratricopeptide (TPR) repeat protein
MRNEQFRNDRESIKGLLAQFENLRAGRPNSYIEQDGFERIIEYFDGKNRIQEALVACEYAVQQFPNNTDLLLIKANLLVVSKNFKDALDIIHFVESMDSTDFNLYIIKTDIYLGLDMPEKAAEVLEFVPTIFSDEELVELYFEIAEVFDDYQQFEKVFDCLVNILSIDPGNEEALIKICFWTDHTGRNEEAIQLCKRIIDEQPFNDLAWFNLGAAYQGLKLYEKSIDAYEYAIAINEKFENAFRNIGDAYIRLRQYEKAIEALLQVISLDAADEIVYEAIGFCYDKLEDYNEARFFYKKATSVNPEDSHLYYKIAVTYMNQASWQNAVKLLQVALRKNGLHADYNMALGQCYMQLGKLEDALIRFSNVINSKPKNANAWAELLNCFLMGQYFNDGIMYAEMAYEQTEKKPLFLYYKSMFLFCDNKSKEASIILEEAVAQNPKLLKKIIEINPTLLQYSQVVEILAKHKRKRAKK